MDLRSARWIKRWAMVVMSTLMAVGVMGTLYAHEIDVTPSSHGGHPIEVILNSVIPYIAGVIELVGVAIIVYGAVAALFLFTRSHLDFNNAEVKLELAQALALSLEFKLAAEILKSVIVRTLQELVLLAAIVALRVVMTLLIHWEIETSEAEGEAGKYRQTTSENTLSARIRERREEGKQADDINRQGFVYRRKKSGEGSSPNELTGTEGDVRQMRPTEVTTYEETHEAPFIMRPRHVTRKEDGLMITIERNLGRLIKKRSGRHQRRMQSKRTHHTTQQD